MTGVQLPAYAITACLPFLRTENGFLASWSGGVSGGVGLSLLSLWDSHN